MRPTLPRRDHLWSRYEYQQARIYYRWLRVKNGRSATCINRVLLWIGIGALVAVFLAKL